MPGFSGTGPQNAGPMTGRGLGYCMAYLEQSSLLKRRPGMGGRGWRHCYNATGLPRWSRWESGKTITGGVYASPFSSKASLDELREQVSYLEKALDEAKKRIQELETRDNNNPLPPKE